MANEWTSSAPNLPSGKSWSDYRSVYSGSGSTHAVDLSVSEIRVGRTEDNKVAVRIMFSGTIGGAINIDLYSKHGSNEYTKQEVFATGSYTRYCVFDQIEGNSKADVWIGYYPERYSSIELGKDNISIPDSVIVCRVYSGGEFISSSSVKAHNGSEYVNSSGIYAYTGGQWKGGQ